MGRSARNKSRMTGLSLVSKTFQGLSLPTERVTLDLRQPVLSLETRLQYDGTEQYFSVPNALISSLVHVSGLLSLIMSNGA